MQIENVYSGYNLDLNKTERTWLLTKYQVQRVSDFLRSSTFKDNIGLLYSNPIENIVSLKVFPLDFARLGYSTANTKLTIGSVQSDIENVRLLTRTQITFLVYTGYIEKLYNNFLDYAPYTQISIYLPYVESGEIDVDKVMGKEIKIYYTIDVISGKCVASIFSENVLINTFNGEIGVDIILNASNLNEIAKNMLLWTGNTINSALSVHSPQGILSFGVNASMSALNNQKIRLLNVGKHQPYISMVLPQNIAIYISRPRYTPPSNYNSVYGLPLNESRQLSTLNGYTQISEIHLENIEGATLEEIREIKRLLSEGVILSGDSTEFTFTVNGETYTSTGATTWETWVNTIYNTGGWFIKDMRVARVSGDGYEVIQGAFVDEYIQSIQYITRYEIDTFPFYINGVPYSSPYNFTWVQWVNSVYNDNVNKWYIKDNQIRRSILFGYEYISGSPVSALITPNDIINNVDYETTDVLTEISFTIDSYPHITSIDTTWREWVNSSNNENSLYKIWGDKIYRMENNIIRVVEGVGGIEVTPDDTIESFDYTTGTLSTLTFTLFNLDSTTSIYTATINTKWNDWLSSPYSALKFTRINNFVCVLDSSLQPHKVLKDITAEPQTITDIVEATAYSVDSNIYT